MGRGDILPTKGLIYEALNLINLFLTKGSRDGGAQGSINTISTPSGTFTKGALVKA